ncbi:MAG: winged helix-turn-helix transcriptional regulator [Sodaliphilus sp.]
MTHSQITDPIFPECPVRNVLARVCDKWSLLVMHTLNKKGTPLRYKDLQSSIPDISQKMLNTTLRKLTADGFITRKAYPEIPPRVEYQLTDRARSFLMVMKPIVKWAVDNFAPIIHDRAAFENNPSHSHQ